MSFKRPIIPVAISLAAGVLLGKRAPVAFYISAPLLLLFITLAFAAYMKKRNEEDKGRGRLTMITMLAGVAFIAGVMTIRTAQIRSLRADLGLKTVKRMKIRAEIILPPEYRGRHGRIVVRLLKAGKENVEDKKINAEVYFNRKKTAKFEPLYKGIKIEFKGLYLPYDFQRNPGQMDQLIYNRHRNVHERFRLNSITGIDKKNVSAFWSFVYNTRMGLRKSISRSLQRPYSDIVKGMVLGRHNELPNKVKSIFKRTGALHVMAASGLHVSIVIGITLLVLYPFSLPRKVKYLLTLPSIAFYALVAGGSPSIIRASIMGALVVIALFVERDYDPLDALFWAGFIMLAMNPYNLFSASFQLSFTAVLGIVLLFGPVRSMLPDRDAIVKFFNFRMNKKPAEILTKAVEGLFTIVIVTVSAYVSLAPVMIYYFNYVSLVNLPANLVIVPALGLFLPLGLAGGLIGIVFPAAGAVIFLALKTPLIIVMKVMMFLAGLEFAVVRLPSPGWPFIVMYYLILLLLTAGPPFIRHNRKRLLAAALLIASIFVLKASYDNYNRCQAVFFSSRRNCPVLFRSREGTFLYFLGNCKTTEWRTGGPSWNVLPYLRKNGIFRLDVLIVDTGDEKHAPAVLSFFKECDVKNLYLGDNVVKTGYVPYLKKITDVTDTRIYRYDTKLAISAGSSRLTAAPADMESPLLMTYTKPGTGVYLLNPNVDADKALPENRPKNAVVAYIAGRPFEYYRGMNVNPEYRVDTGNHIRWDTEEETVERAMIFDMSGKRPERIKWR